MPSVSPIMWMYRLFSTLSSTYTSTLTPMRSVTSMRKRCARPAGVASSKSTGGSVGVKVRAGSIG